MKQPSGSDQKAAASRRRVKRGYGAKALGSFVAPGGARKAVQNIGRLGHLHYDPATGRRRSR